MYKKTIRVEVFSFQLSNTIPIELIDLDESLDTGGSAVDGSHTIDSRFFIHSNETEAKESFEKMLTCLSLTFNHPNPKIYNKKAGRGLFNFKNTY